MSPRMFPELIGLEEEQTTVATESEMAVETEGEPSIAPDDLTLYADPQQSAPYGQGLGLEPGQVQSMGSTQFAPGEEPVMPQSYAPGYDEALDLGLPNLEDLAPGEVSVGAAGVGGIYGEASDVSSALIAEESAKEAARADEEKQLRQKRIAAYEAAMASEANRAARRSREIKQSAEKYNRTLETTQKKEQEARIKGESGVRLKDVQGFIEEGRQQEVMEDLSKQIEEMVGPPPLDATRRQNINRGLGTHTDTKRLKEWQAQRDIARKTVLRRFKYQEEQDISMNYNRMRLENIIADQALRDSPDYKKKMAMDIEEQQLRIDKMKREKESAGTLNPKEALALETAQKRLDKLNIDIAEAKGAPLKKAQEEEYKAEYARLQRDVTAHAKQSAEINKTGTPNMNSAKQLYGYGMGGVHPDGMNSIIARSGWSASQSSFMKAYNEGSSTLALDLIEKTKAGAVPDLSSQDVAKMQKILTDTTGDIETRIKNAAGVISGKNDESLAMRIAYGQAQKIASDTMDVAIANEMKGVRDIESVETFTDWLAELAASVNPSAIAQQVTGDARGLEGKSISAASQTLDDAIKGRADISGYPVDRWLAIAKANKESDYSRILAKMPSAIGAQHQNKMDVERKAIEDIKKVDAGKVARWSTLLGNGFTQRLETKKEAAERGENAFPQLINAPIQTKEDLKYMETQALAIVDPVLRDRIIVKIKKEKDKFDREDEIEYKKKYEKSWLTFASPAFDIASNIFGKGESNASPAPTPSPTPTPAPAPKTPAKKAKAKTKTAPTVLGPNGEKLTLVNGKWESA